ncbi:ABC transporter ATP-binding protein [Ruminococcus sp. FC2018]|uniref:ABC transporter ATP-binding protein n=1 Tax=Ruminococcus sp. FC2018 TaxID=1410617 RepID=UPI0012DED10C|nr:ABC transporter ATP-binding protein [Ruminococcus sp. FC2018]
MGYASPYKSLFALSLVFALISVGATLYAPILIGQGVDVIVGKGDVDFDKLIPIIIILLVTVAVTALCQWLMTVCTNKITFNIVRDLRNEAFAKLEKLPLSYIDSHPHGDLISRVITDVEQISDGLLMGFAQLFTGLCTIVGTLIFMLTINLKITLVVVLITPLSLFVARFVSDNTYKLFHKQSVARGELTGLIEEMTGNQKTVSAFGYEQQAQQRMQELNQELSKVSVKAIFFSSLTNPTTRFVNGLVYTGVGIVGAFTVFSGGMTVGQLSSFLTYANQYTKPFNEISGVITELQGALASAHRVFSLLSEKEIPDDSRSKVLEKIDGSVDVDSVDFSYTPQKPLIQGFDLHVKKGQRTAIVGPTGCGKTTMINLLMRFYDTDKGEIKVSGENIRDVTRKSLRAGYGMVLQETWLKTGTIRENIAYGKPDATDEEIIAAARAAYCHSFIKRLPLGYDTVISDSYSTLSAGQKQLLCIARVMLCVPQMLILDEATSSIDTRTEILVQNAFAKLMQGRTSFIIAHRLSTIKEADTIIVMKDGTIIEQGDHKSLMDKNGFYAQLYNSQFAIS